MMRAYKKGWQDRRPGFRRRVKWYEGKKADGTPSIRLQFETEQDDVWNEHFSSTELAERAYEAFIEYWEGIVAEERA